MSFYGILQTLINLKRVESLTKVHSDWTFKELQLLCEGTELKSDIWMSLAALQIPLDSTENTIAY